MTWATLHGDDLKSDFDTPSSSDDRDYDWYKLVRVSICLKKLMFLQIFTSIKFSL